MNRSALIGGMPVRGFWFHAPAVNPLDLDGDEK